MRCTLVLTILLAVASGCKEKEPRPAPAPLPTATIPIKVWIVLEKRDTPEGTHEDTLGDVHNWGCRLSQAQVIDQIDHLQASAKKLYGGAVTFEWDRQPTRILYKWLLGPMGNRTRSPADFETEIVDHHSDDNTINIYFVGNVQVPPPLGRGVDGEAVGLTVDPRDAQWRSIPRPYIVMNDCGRELRERFVDGRAPEEVRALNAFEHEMTHYLGRLNTRLGWGPGGARTYDRAEHVLYGGATNEDNIMLPDLTGGALPLHIPGAIDDTDTEKGSIWARISTDGWKNP
jgi:hypothetical protein